MTAESISRIAADMLAHLQANRLEVAKWPSARGGYVRGAINHNTDWYRRFCAAYQRRPTRRFPKAGRTSIKRCHTVNALRNLIVGRHRPTPYVERLLPFLHAYEPPSPEHVPTTCVCGRGHAHYSQCPF